MSDTAVAREELPTRENGSMAFLKLMAGVLSILALIVGFLLYVQACAVEVRREAATVYASKDAVSSLKDDIERLSVRQDNARIEMRADIAALAMKIDKLAEKR